MKYFAYCRKSSEGEERQALSIPAQIDEINRLAASDPNIQIVGWFEERMSAKAPGRPVYGEVISRIEKGEADALLAWHPDRLARNSVDGGWIIHLLDRRVLKDLKFASYKFENTPEGMFMLQIMFGQSKYYVDNLSINVKRGMRKKFETGWLPTKPPIGYKNNRETGTIDLDTDRAPLIQRIWDLFLTGAYSVPELRNIANNKWGLTTPVRKRRGGTQLCLSSYYKILNNPFYAGINVWNGDWRVGRHKALITVEQFDRAQELLGRPGRPRPQTRKFAYTGLLRCACGLSVTAEQHTKPSGKRYVYYRCTRRAGACKEPAVRVEVLERIILDRLRTISLSAATHVMLSELWPRYNEETRHLSESVGLANSQAISEARSNLRTLTDLRVRSMISDEEFAERRTDLQNRITKLEAAAAAEPPEKLNLAPSLIDFGKHCVFWFSNGSVDVRRLLVQILCLNPVLSARNLKFDARFPFVDETSVQHFPLWWASVDHVRTQRPMEAAELVELTAYIAALFKAREANEIEPPISSLVAKKLKVPQGPASWRPKHLRKAA
jgi:DNA invertase Pin-like site-specific DNA recombinase